jgi:DNA polymerase-3 subunit epsilon
MIAVALDFETANRHRHSACQVALIRADDGRVTRTLCTLLDPGGEFEALQVALHGIGPDAVQGAPRLADLWPELAALLRDADRVIAHNAAFDRGVLEKTLAAQGVDPPELPWECTVQRARRLLPHLPDHRLPTVCQALGVTLARHHDAESDAQATLRLAFALDALQAAPALACTAPTRVLRRAA